MSRPESILVSMEFTTASRSHQCGHDREHRIETGAARLTIRSHEKEHHLCVRCAKALLAQGAEQVRLLLAGAQSLLNI